MENETLKLRKEIKLETFNLPVKVLTNSNVKAILQSNVTAIANAEDTGGYISINGKAHVNFVYKTEEDLIENADLILDFSQKQKNNTKLTNIKPEIASNLIDISFSNNEIYANINNFGKLVGVVEVNFPVANSLEEEYVCESKNFKAQTISDVFSETFVVAEESESNLKGIKILDSMASVQVGDITCGVDKITLEGTIFINFLYGDGENLGNIGKTIEFKQEISAEKVLPNENAFADLLVKNITISPEEKEDKSTLVYAVELQANCYVVDEFETQLINDIYSLNNELIATYEFVEFKEFASSQIILTNLTSQTDISDIENFDDLICVGNPIFKINKSTSENEKIFVEGQFESNVFYKDNNGIQSFKIVKPETFFIDAESSETFNFLNVSVQVVSTRVRAGKELEITYKLIYRLENEKIINEDFVKSFQISEQKQEDDFGVKVYVAKSGQSVYDVAKVLNVRPELILEQNKEIDGILESGQKVYVYKQINL